MYRYLIAGEGFCVAQWLLRQLALRPVDHPAEVRGDQNPQQEDQTTGKEVHHLCHLLEGALRMDHPVDPGLPLRIPAEW